ncbi:DUF4249 domain-containing protein [Spirosoma validum]|uniref:DUF4249 domain-containing protein n=1 Tax=Spirosoma validum TaxID=2771355 RepID=A0A927B3L3_9BACT|nr:DUF4249 domain-containing protein [Spirosoma validum]MBD2754622.1 DUF4249 domain-containing protein [Spirosoma validum]
MERNVLIYILAIILFTACNSLRQEVEPKGLVQEPEKLVVACFISPQDTVLAALVSRTLPVLGTGNQYNTDITNATVTLSDGQRSVILKLKPSVPNSGIVTSYRANVSELPIVTGKTYKLTVRVPDGREVTGTCTVPESVVLNQITVDSATTTDFGLSRKEYYARMRWRDPAGQTNFYRVTGNNEFTYTYKTQTSPNGPIRDTTMRMWGDWYFTTGSTLTDLGRDGQEIISGRGRLAISYSWANGKQNPSFPRQLNAHLMNVDENYYRYHDAVERQNQAGDNPFAEPVPIPTNIQGGLGCFGAYNRSTLTMQLK